MSDFSSLKRNRTDISKLNKAIESLNTYSDNSSKDDDRFWVPETDKAGNGMAIIRFLPAPAVDGDDALPWVRIFNHGFQGPGGWLIDGCLTTIGQKCPVCEHNGNLWNSGNDANKDIARKQKRKVNYIANVLIISDPKNPGNEGQVKLFKFGKKIFDKISEAMNPEFEDEKAVNPFDFWEGANFKLKMRQVEGYRNYDKSEFESVSPLFDGDDAKLESIWKKEYSLNEYLDPKQFKSYEQIKSRLEKVLGFEGVVMTSRAEDVVLKPAKNVDDVPFTPSASSSADDDDLDYFKSLAED
jgi:hypothetical protein